MPLVSTLWRQRQDNLCIVYIASPRTPRATQENLVAKSKTTTKKNFMYSIYRIIVTLECYLYYLYSSRF